MSEVEISFEIHNFKLNVINIDAHLYMVNKAAKKNWII